MIGVNLGYARALSETYDCVSCGACCYGKRDYVQVFADDVTRLTEARQDRFMAAAVGESPASTGRAAEPQRFMKMTHGHCAALDTSVPHHFPCKVYEARPMLCRAFEPGSRPCLEARARRNVTAHPSSPPGPG